MANVLNRVTRVFIESVNTPDYPIADWIIGPDLSPVAGVPPKYWTINADDTVTLMTVAEQAAVDEAELKAEKDNLSTHLDRVLKAVILALNDGSFVPGSNYTPVQLKTIIRGKL